MTPWLKLKLKLKYLDVAVDHPVVVDAFHGLHHLGKVTVRGYGQGGCAPTTWL